MGFLKRRTGHLSRRMADRMYLLNVRSIIGVQAAQGLSVQGRPLIKIDRGCLLALEHNIVLNSRNTNYHVNMHAPVKLMADGNNSCIVIGAHTRIHGTCIHASDRVEIGRRCLIAANTQIIDNNRHDLSFANVEMRGDTTGTPRPVHIGDDVWIGLNVIVLPGTSIGQGSVIAAGSVISGNVPPMSLVRGNPGIVVKRFQNSDDLKFFQKNSN